MNSALIGPCSSAPSYCTLGGEGRAVLESSGVVVCEWLVVDPPAEMLASAGLRAAWLAGHVEVEVVRESFHQAAVHAAAADPGTGGMRTAMLAPAPPYSKFPIAVAVYVQTHLVGHLPADFSQQVHQRPDRTARHRGH